MVIRKNVTELTSAEKSELTSAIKAIKASGKYDQHVLRHALAPMTAIHRSPAFLPWHRYFLVDYEKDLQQASGNPDLALPYWNWAEDAARPDPTSAPVWANDLMGGNGDPADNWIVKTGPFRQGEWTIVNSSGSPAGPLIRRFGVAAPTLPTQADVDNALATTPFDTSPWNASSIPSFRNRLEGWYGAAGPGLHNRGHVWVGGSMLPMTSPNDPVFFLHHCFVDKLWADWQAKFPNELYLPQSGGPAGHNLNDLMERTVSGQVKPADVLDHLALGYTYDTLAVNRPPVLAPIAPIIVDENGRADRTIHASDPDGQTVHFAVDGPAFATLTDNNDNTAELSVQPGFEDSGHYLATVKATDPEDAFDEKNVSITVRNVNRPPVLENIDRILVREGSQLVRTITGSDPDRQVVEFSVSNLPHFATFSDEGAGVGRLTLRPGFKDDGLYHTTLTITDPEGATDSESFTIQVINVLLPLTTQIEERPFQRNEGVIELKVNNLLPDLASQVQIQSGASWNNITNANGDRAWFHENLKANEVVRYAYGPNALGGQYRWVIHDKAEGLDKGWAVSAEFFISEMGKHIIVEVTLPSP